MALKLLALVAIAVCAVQADSSCFLEPGYSYDSLWNTTALRICPGVERPEKVCIVGGGSSGVHLGWALKRRGYDPVLFERNDRLGGEIWTRHRVPNPDGADDDDDVTRELGAAFLSPDYDEVRALLQRYNQTEQPISAVTEMRFHAHYLGGGSSTGGAGDVHFTAEGLMVVGQEDREEEEGGQEEQGRGVVVGGGDAKGEHAVSPSEWCEHWTAQITGDLTNQTANDLAVSGALDAYVALHEFIFGDMGKLRFPPKPDSQEKLDLFADMGGLAFLVANGLAVLQPTFYQFFVLQGMGRLDAMPAYYMLKWINPATLSAGGFGNDPTTPLAMLTEGYGAMVDALATEVALDVRLNATVTNIQRQGLTSGYNGTSPVQLTVIVTTPSSASGGAKKEAEGSKVEKFEEKEEYEEVFECDVLALTGPIPEFVKGSEDGSRPPILDPPTLSEISLFSSKKPMQFLVSLLDLETAPENYETLEFWPANFQTAGGVIVHRDVAYSEEEEEEDNSSEGGMSHRVGGVQSFSYHPWPRCDEAHHVASQALWLARHNLSTASLLGRAYFDTYLFHYETDGIVAGKPWQLSSQQQPFSGSHTVYVGGSAGYETVEDSLQFNLQLLDSLFDTNDDNDDDDKSRHKKEEDARQDKEVASSSSRSSSSSSSSSGGSRWYHVNPALGSSSHSPSVLSSAVKKEEGVNEYGWPVLAADSESSCASSSLGPRLEQLSFTLACGDVDKFAAADDKTWSAFLVTQKGFVRKTTLLDPSSNTTTATTKAGGGGAENCTVWSVVQWSSLELWKSIDPDTLARVQAAFEKAYGEPGPIPVPYPPPPPTPPSKNSTTVDDNDDDDDNYEDSNAGLELLLDVPLPIDEPFPVRARWQATSSSTSSSMSTSSSSLVSTEPPVGGVAKDDDDDDEDQEAAAAAAVWSLAQVVEEVKSTVQPANPSQGCTDSDVQAFVDADNATWSVFLATQHGFIRKLTLVERQQQEQPLSKQAAAVLTAATTTTTTTGKESAESEKESLSSSSSSGSEGSTTTTTTTTMCFVWTRSMWATLQDYQQVDAQGASATATAFEAQLGYSPTTERFPQGSGYSQVLVEREMPRGPRSVVLSGVDVVAFQHPRLLIGGIDHDVRGTPEFAITIDAADLLPPSLRPLHPRPYEFWFSSSENAELFRGNPLKYAPAVGGHCTHGLATLVDGELSASQLVDGRLGFVCVNTTNWGQVLSDGRLYMNSCGMYDDFMVDPEKDAAAANALWEEWFGPTPNTTTAAAAGAAPAAASEVTRITQAVVDEESVGPFNDACVQDGATWGGPPHYTNGLLPPRCTII